MSLLYTSDMAGAPAEGSRLHEQVVLQPGAPVPAKLQAAPAPARAQAAERRSGGPTRRRRDAASGLATGW